TMAFAASWGISQNKNKVSFSDLALSNVEALANNENDSFHDDQKGLKYNGSTGCCEGPASSTSYCRAIHNCD
ncbi:hypothetical protein D0T51_12320, partial [Parabacteroides sp. 52]|nr:hypothetical protein [Parabacteroides sp. 52]